MNLNPQWSAVPGTQTQLWAGLKYSSIARPLMVVDQDGNKLWFTTLHLLAFLNINFGFP
jgi:hypothetical protein